MLAHSDEGEALVNYKSWTPFCLSTVTLFWLISRWHLVMIWKTSRTM